MHVFSLQNMEAAYKKGKPVLSIDNLKIKKGKMVFLLGKSGIGKSTMLELLGLMNNTLSSNGTINFYYDNETFSYNNVWKYNNTRLAQFRNRFFSFIFQNENLMQNFTAGENICFTQMMQGKTFADAKKDALTLMDKLEIQQNKFDAKISEFSGGQRQRLSFIRAIAVNYNVLFGDEPTGNLDDQNAHNLMQVLKDDMLAKEASALIVSHQIDMALKFADQIILFSEKKAANHAYGVIETENVFESQQWVNNPVQFKQQVKNILK